MSQLPSGVLQGFVEKNSPFPMLLLDDALVKLIPASRVERIKKEILRVAYNEEREGIASIITELDSLKSYLQSMPVEPAISTIGNKIDTIKEKLESIASSDNKHHLEELLKLVFYDPTVAVFGGYGCEISSVTSIKSIDARMESVVKRKVQDNLSSNANDRDLKEVLYNIHSIVADLGNDENRKRPAGRSGRSVLAFEVEEEEITAVDFINNNVSFAIAPFPRNDGAKCVFALMHVPSYRVRHSGGVQKMQSSGVWEFPTCVIGTAMTWTRLNEGAMRIGFSKIPYIVYPKHYKHMYVYDSDNHICTGSFSGSEGERKIIAMDNPIIGVYEFLLQVRQVIVTGYSVNSHPAGGHLNDERFKEFKKWYTTDNDEINERVEIARAEINREIKGDRESLLKVR